MWKIFVGILLGAAGASFVLFSLFRTPAPLQPEVQGLTSLEDSDTGTRNAEVPPAGEALPASSRSDPQYSEAASEPTGSAGPDAEESTVPIAVVPELERLIESHAGSQLHALIERESVDAAWASTMEQGWSTFLLEKQEIAQVGGRPTVNCRSTMCEIQLVAYGGTDLEWSEIIFNSGLSEQPWADGIRPFGVLLDEEDGVTSVLVLTQTRRPIDSP